MKKFLILGLVIAAVGCSTEPQIEINEINKAAALATIKGSYKTTLKTLEISLVGITPGTDVTIDTLNFFITADEPANNLNFEYLDVKEGWIVYKVTFAGTTKFTALATSVDLAGTEYIITEFNRFRDSQDDITYDEKGFTFLEKQ